MGNRTRQPSAYDADWRRRHPERAAEERQFRLDEAERQRLHAKRDRLKDLGTVETRQKLKGLHQGAIARLFRSGHLDTDDLASADFIRRVAERIGRDVSIRTMSMETRIDGGGSGDGTFFEALGAVRAEIAYTRWRRDLGPGAGAVLAVIEHDEACRSVARRWHMRDETLRRLIATALASWPWYYRDAREEVSEADLIAAQAAIL